MFTELINNINFILINLRFQDVIDLILVWFVVYRILILIRSSGTVQMLSGLGIMAISYVVSIWLELFTFNWLLEKFFNNLFVIVVILFQGEIRRALAQIGINPFYYHVTPAHQAYIIEELSKSLSYLAQKGMGALIIIERDINVDYHIEDGFYIGAKISKELLDAIFQPSSQLHDGAVIIRGDKIFSASCFLPLSKSPHLDRKLGTRHRAAIGLSEETDAVVFVVSEEHKSIGIAQGGHLTSNADTDLVRKVLSDVLSTKGLF